MLLNTCNRRRRSRQAVGAAPGIQDLGAKPVPNVGAPTRIIPRCRQAEASPVCSVGFLLIRLSWLRTGIRNQ